MFFALSAAQRGFADTFERFLKDLLDTCLKFLLHSVPDPPRQRKASVTHDPKRLDTCLKFLLHSVPDPPRQRKASVTHDPFRVMCYDQLLRACLQSLMKKLWRGFPVDPLKNA